MDFSYNGERSLIALREIPLTHRINQVAKRSIDVLLSLFVLIFIMPWLTIGIGLCMKICMPGPVFFVQRRSGKNNKVFKCIKFRSMEPHNCADHFIDPSTVTSQFGCLLRMTSIDELPQFWNVLKGDMSIIGPRPHMLAHDEEYEAIIPEYNLRYAIKPGITGWAQVNGLRGERDISRVKMRVEHDLWYITNWSLSLDFKIMCRTLGVMLSL